MRVRWDKINTKFNQNRWGSDRICKMGYFTAGSLDLISEKNQSRIEEEEEREKGHIEDLKNTPNPETFFCTFFLIDFVVLK